MSAAGVSPLPLFFHSDDELALAAAAEVRHVWHFLLLAWHHEHLPALGTVLQGWAIAQEI